MQGRGDKDQPTHIIAGSLCSTHIGELIRFRTRDVEREIVTVVTAELRQISHVGTETHLTYGNMAEREVSMSQATLVILRPAEDYGDVTHHLGFDHDAVRWGKRQ